jgi:hypothetical protein
MPTLADEERKAVADEERKALAAARGGGAGSLRTLC